MWWCAIFKIKIMILGKLDRDHSFVIIMKDNNYFKTDVF